MSRSWAVPSASSAPSTYMAHRQRALRERGLPFWRATRGTTVRNRCPGPVELERPDEGLLLPAGAEGCRSTSWLRTRCTVPGGRVGDQVPQAACGCEVWRAPWRGASGSRSGRPVPASTTGRRTSPASRRPVNQPCPSERFGSSAIDLLLLLSPERPSFQSEAGGGGSLENRDSLTLSAAFDEWGSQGSSGAGGEAAQELDGGWSAGVIQSAARRAIIDGQSFGVPG